MCNGMKYLKKFYESLGINCDEFEEQCEIYISELADLEISVAMS